MRYDLPHGLKPTNVNVSNDLTRRFGMPLVAVNPTDPNNIVILHFSSS